MQGFRSPVEVKYLFWTAVEYSSRCCLVWVSGEQTTAVGCTGKTPRNVLGLFSKSKAQVAIEDTEEGTTDIKQKHSLVYFVFGKRWTRHTAAAVLVSMPTPHHCCSVQVPGPVSVCGWV